MLLQIFGENLEWYFKNLSIFSCFCDLPFFSYGGSSLWGFTILLFILLRLDADRGNYGTW